MIVVSDTSALSNLAIVERLTLLQRLYVRVIIPQAVADELARASSENAIITTVLNFDWIEIQQVTNLTLVESLERDHELDAREAAAIALAVELQAQRLLIDERAGRRAAIRLGLAVTGVLGILIAAKTAGLLPAVRPVMDCLIQQAGFWVSEQLYAEILLIAEE